MEKEFSIRELKTIAAILSGIIIILLFFLFTKSKDASSLELKISESEFRADSLRQKIQQQAVLLLNAKRTNERLEARVDDAMRSRDQALARLGIAQRDREAMRRRMYTQEQVDSAFKARYESYRDKSLVMELPIPTGVDIVNDLQAFDKTKDENVALHAVVQADKEAILSQSVLVNGLKNQIQLHVDQENLFKEQVKELNLQADLWKADSQNKDKKIKWLRIERNVSLGLNAFQFVKSALK